jgi:hypothetical protein
MEQKVNDIMIAENKSQFNRAIGALNSKKEEIIKENNKLHKK